MDDNKQFLILNFGLFVFCMVMFGLGVTIWRNEMAGAPILLGMGLMLLSNMFGVLSGHLKFNR